MGLAEHGWAGPAPPAGEAVLHVALILLGSAGRPAGDALLMLMTKACGSMWPIKTWAWNWHTVISCPIDQSESHGQTQSPEAEKCALPH